MSAIHSNCDLCRKTRGGFAPAFTPIGQESTNQNSRLSAPTSTTNPDAKRAAEESQAKIAAKRAKLSKYGLKFQSAGTLTSITEQLGSDTSTYRTPSIIQRLTGDTKEDDGQAPSSSSDKRIAFGIQPVKSKPLAPVAFQSSEEKSYTSVWKMPESKGPRLEPITKGPPPLMSRQRELNMEKAFGDDSSDEDELKLVPIKRGPTKFKFNLRK